MADSILMKAYRSQVIAKQLEREGRRTEAIYFWQESRNMYAKACTETKPDEQGGRRARLGLVKTTFKFEGLERATKVLVSMIKSGDIPPRTIEELKTYLGIKPKD